MGKYSSQVIEQPTRQSKYDKSLGLIANGEFNDYPEYVEQAINNSPTAKSCAKLFKRFCMGKGFDMLNDLKVDRDMTLLDLLNRASYSFSFQNGIFIHVNWNADYKIKTLKVLPYSHCRIGKKDDKQYSGKVIVYDNWAEAKKSKKHVDKFHVIDVFNPKEEIISEQVTNAGGWNDYKGQVLFVNSDPYTYPLAHIDCALNDAVSEYNASEYKATSLKSGFFGKTMVVTPPMIDAELHELSLTEDQKKLKRSQETEKEAFQNTLKGFIGAENAEGILHFEMDFDGDNIDEAILFKKIESDIDDKMFEHTEISSARNIRKAFYNVPQALVEDSEGALFGNSGEAIKQMKEFYQEQTEEPRLFLEKTFNKLLSHFKGIQLPEEGLKIQKLINVNIQD